MISLDQYFMGRVAQYPNDFTPEIKQNAEDLLNRVNGLLSELGQLEGLMSSNIQVSSGWRPPAVNAATPGSAKRSLHMSGKAVDIVDPHRILYGMIMKHSQLLHKYGLWMESMLSTNGWVHLDNSTARVDRNIRVFLV